MPGVVRRRVEFNESCLRRSINCGHVHLTFGRKLGILTLGTSELNYLIQIQSDHEHLFVEHYVYIMHGVMLETLNTV